MIVDRLNAYKRRVAGGASPVVSVVSSSAFCSDGGSVSVAIRFLRDGTITVQDDCSGFAFDQNYLASGLPDATIGDLYEVMLSVTSGPDPTSGPALDAFIALSALRQWTWTDSPGVFDSGSWLYTIREIADTGNTDNDTFTWDTEDGS